MIFDRINCVRLSLGLDLLHEFAYDSNGKVNDRVSQADAPLPTDAVAESVRMERYINGHSGFILLIYGWK